MNYSRKFYEDMDREIYAAYNGPKDHGAYNYLIKFIEDYELYDKKCLEIGSSKGLFQDMVKDYTGLDIATSLKQYYHKPFCLVNADGTYPFKNETFDATWAIAVHEHIPNIDQALMELMRVLKPGGVLFFWPAWFCSTWAADGYLVRAYSDFGLKGKLIKALIPFRGSVFWRAIYILPKRIKNHFLFCIGKYYSMQYKELKANYDHYWLSDSDACNSMDPHDTILWFESNGFKCLSHPLHLKAFFVRHRPIILRKL